MQLKDTVAFVTGTNRGLGLQLITLLKQNGVTKIYAASRQGNTEVEGVVNVKLDITNPEEIRAAVALATDTTLLINNAGINLYAGLMKSPDLDHAKMEMNTNYFGTLAMCRAFAPVLSANGGGTIVNISSIIGKVSIPMSGSLCASKAALISLTQGIRAELAAQNTRVILVMPGAIDTDMSRFIPPPKANPADVAHEIIKAIQTGEEEVYPDPMAQGIAQGLIADPKAVERQFAAYLPQ
jgi:NAD(P)-dependent dehydrogenase (short-subunit alcohol dehydrogenase family)